MKKASKEPRSVDISVSNAGDTSKVDAPVAGDRADAAGISKGKGIVGVTKRRNPLCSKEIYGLGFAVRYVGLSGVRLDFLRAPKGKKSVGYSGVERAMA